MHILKFITLWLLIFIASYMCLSALNFVPTEVEEFNYRTVETFKSWFSHNVSAQNKGDGLIESTSSTEAIIETPRIVLPDRVTIPKIGVDFPVLNPETRDPVVLYNALLSGVVRYPGSAGLLDNSNMLLFGHSTTYALVKHQAYKALNHLETLSLGDTVVLYSGTTEYVYTVTSVSSVGTDGALVKFGTGARTLTLSTCDTFGGNAKNSRIVVEAKFKESHETGVLPVEKNQ